MKIAGYDVTSVTKTHASVGCTSVTLEEARALVKEMEMAKVGFVRDGYTAPTHSPSGKQYANFTLEDQEEGWFSANVQSDKWTGRKAQFCLNRDKAKELFDFLADYFNRFPSRS